MRNYLSTFKRVFPGVHYVFASITLALGLFASLYAVAVSQGFFLRSAITRLDQNMLSLVLIQRGDTRSAFFLFFTYLGNWEIIASLSIVILIIMFLARKIRAMWFFSLALVIGQASSFLFKYLLLRSRPDTSHALIEQGGYSFPSGHALGAFIFYGMLGYFLYSLTKKHWQHITITISTVSIIGLIGVSRLYLGVHWFSDVLAGWLMGATLLIVFIVFFEHRKAIFPVTHRILFLSKKVLTLITAILIIAEVIFIGYYYITHPVLSLN